MFFGANDWTAVDIGSHSIKVVRMKQTKDGLNILNRGINEIPADTVSEGMIKDSAIVVNELETLFGEMGFTPRRVITTVSNNNLIIRNLEVPQMAEDELQEAIKWEAEDQIPFPVDYSSMDYIILGEEEEMLQLLLVAVKKEVVDSFLEPFKQIGIRTDVVNVQPMALLSILEYQEELTEPVAIISLGASGTQFTIGSDDNIFLSRTIDIGGLHFTDTLIEGMGMEFEEAEEYKINNGIQDFSEEDDDYIDSLQIAATSLNSSGEYLSSLAVNLAEEISRSLNFYSMNNRGGEINKIYITGGGSKLTGIKEIISDEIGQEIISIDTFDSFAVDELEEKNNEEYAVAVGLIVSEVLAGES